jgi:hypothetical protein
MSSYICDTVRLGGCGVKRLFLLTSFGASQKK